ncbi:MAG: DUF1194 domain-containing protein [Alphaproteobacteria bacterium]|nr:DUF1194 domain-containing protein [Alphaproteobacteria bacterium]
MPTIKCYIGVLLISALTAGTLHAQRLTPVDLELAFVVDASGSIDEEEMALQRQGYATALAHPRVLKAIKSGFLQSIFVAYIEFAGFECTRLTVGWGRVADKKTAEEYGARILAAERNLCFGGNAVSEALAFAAATIDANSFEGTRRVIDISGDGPNTMGEQVEVVRDAIVKKRIVINALAIKRESMPDLPEYFRDSVTGGPGSFVLKAKDRKSFAEAIQRKLIREIADRTPWPTKQRASLR